MTPRILPLVAALCLIPALSASAQFLNTDTATGNVGTDFGSKRNIPARPAELLNAARDAEKAGWTLYRYETVADIAAADLVAGTTPAQRENIAGSIVIPGEQWRVRFYSRNGNTFSPVADVLVDNKLGNTIVPKGATRSFSDAELALIKAQELVQAEKAPCDGTYKTIALPGATGISVYRIRESFDKQRLPEGQHLRYTVSADGNSITETTELARRCNVLTTTVKPDTGTEGKDLTIAGIQAPGEIHVYLSLRYGVDLAVFTTSSNTFWSVKGGRISID
jgi:hypothetical protein